MKKYINRSLQEQNNFKMIDLISTIFPIDEPSWKPLEDKMTIKVLKAGDHWVRQGDQSREFAFIMSGLLRVYYVQKSGKELIEGFYDDGKTIAAISALVSEMPCQYYIQALEDTQLITLDYYDFFEFAKTNPQLLLWLLEVHQSLFIDKAKRDAKRILCNGEERYQWFAKEYPQLLDRIPQYHIASFLGITPVSLSRIRRKQTNQ